MAILGVSFWSGLRFCWLRVTHGNSHSAQQNGQIAENRADQHHLRRRFVPDSPLERDGFEPSVPLVEAGRLCPTGDSKFASQNSAVGAGCEQFEVFQSVAGCRGQNMAARPDRETAGSSGGAYRGNDAGRAIHPQPPCRVAPGGWTAGPRRCFLCIKRPLQAKPLFLES
jgi:hypothetical protein